MKGRNPPSPTFLPFLCALSSLCSCLRLNPKTGTRRPSINVDSHTYFSLFGVRLTGAFRYFTVSVGGSCEKYHQNGTPKCRQHKQRPQISPLSIITRCFVGLVIGYPKKKKKKKKTHMGAIISQSDAARRAESR